MDRVMRDELVASTPAVNTALAAGHRLYAAEMTVTRYLDFTRDAGPKLRARYAEQLTAALARRDELTDAYVRALAEVQAVNPATAEHVEDATTRAFLIEEAFCWVCGDDGHQPFASCLQAAGATDYAKEAQ